MANLQTDEDARPPVASPVTVLGAGQCGSKVTIGVSLSLNPFAIPGGAVGPSMVVKGEVTTDTNTIAAYLRCLFGRAKQASSAPIPHDFYVADMNLQNATYIDLLKRRLMASYLSTTKAPSFDDCTKYIKALEPHLRLESTDAAVFSRIASGKEPATGSLKALSFSYEDTLFADGAGGLQFISEYLALQRNGLAETMRAERNGTLIGVFGAGGGTGAGGVCGALAKYKEKTGRYTLAIAVLPTLAEGVARINAGRLLTRYLSRPMARRLDTLLLFSNAAASRALSQTFASGNRASRLDAMSCINTYLTRFLVAYTQINQPSNRPIWGKVFDPADFRVNFSGPACIGFASGDAKTTDVDSLLSAALAPCTLSATGDLCGLSSDLAEEEGQSVPAQEIAEDLRQILRSDHGSTLAAERLRQRATAYRTLKQLLVVYFVRDNISDALANLETRLIKAFRDITGGRVQVTLAGYQIESAEDDAVMVIASRVALPELIRHFLSYVDVAFLAGREDESDALREAYLAIIDRLRAPHSQKAREEILAEARALFSNALSAEACETLSRGAQGAIAARKEFVSILATPQFKESYCVWANDVVKAASEIAEWAVPPRKH